MSRFEFGYSVNEIRRIRDVEGVGIYQAKMIVRGEKLRDALSTEEPPTNEELRKILFEVVFDLYPRRMTR